MNLRKMEICYTRVANWIEWGISIIEHRLKELWSSKS